MVERAGNLSVENVEGKGRFQIYDIQWEHHFWQFDVSRFWYQYWRQGGGEEWSCENAEIRRTESGWEVFESAEECRAALLSHEDHLQRMRVLPIERFPKEVWDDMRADQARAEKLIEEYRSRPNGGWTSLDDDMGRLVEAQWNALQSGSSSLSG